MMNVHENGDDAATAGASRRPTVRDLARLANVSSGTVSHVLNNKHGVDPALRERVLRAATTLRYTSKPRAAAPAIGELEFFLATAGHPTGHRQVAPFWAHILAGAEREARKNRAHLSFHSLPSDPDDAETAMYSRLAERRLQPTILVGTPSVTLLDAFRRLPVPLVLVDCVHPDRRGDAVLSDDFEGARMIVEHLVDLGHRRIAWIGGPLLPGARRVHSAHTIEWRAIGYRTTLLRAGLGPTPQLEESAPLTSEGGRAAAHRLLRGSEDFTAIFCANDLLCTGVLQAMHEAGVAVPDEVSVAGFDDELADHANPPLTTIRVFKEEMGAVAVRLLAHRVRHPDTCPTTVILPVEAIIRTSTARPGRRRRRPR